MGGRFQEYVGADSKLKSLLSSIKLNLVETKGMQEAFKTLGLQNTEVFPNARLADRSRTPVTHNSELKCVFFSKICVDKGVDYILSEFEDVVGVTVDFYGHVDADIQDRFESFISTYSYANYQGVFDAAKDDALCEIGIDLFAVSNIKEALRIRKAGITGTILVLGYTPIQEIELAISNDITQTIVCEEYAQEIINKYGDKSKALKAHVALDTGMNRIGINAEKLLHCEQVIRDWSTSFMLTGAFTHLCVADSDDLESVTFTNRQIALFETVMDRVNDLHLLQIHCLNSAGGLWRKTKYHGIVRLGIIMYGLKPDYQNNLPDGIKPVLVWKSVVSMVKTIREGETIGYGRTYKTEKKMTVATIPTGYADGYNRHLSNKGFVLIKGAKAPIVGRVCMDQMMVDVTGIDCKMGDEVVLLGDDGDTRFNADDMAQILGTIGYEIVCDIGRRVIRYYT